MIAGNSSKTRDLTQSMRVKTAELLIEPIGYCNLACKYCYTKHTRDLLPPDKILSFIERYVNYVNLPHVRITFIGRGEATLYPHLAELINVISKEYDNRVSFYIQTNGILIHQVLNQLERKDNLEISLSLDGFEKENDGNRGVGTFQKIVQNIQYITSLRIPLNVQTILFPENYRDSRRFQDFIRSISHNITMEFFDILTREEVSKFETETHVPPQISARDPSIVEMRHAISQPEYKFIRKAATDQDLYLCILCDGRVATCCEFQYKIGTIDMDIATLLSKLDLKLCTKCPIQSRCNSNRVKKPEKYIIQDLIPSDPNVVFNK